MDTQELVDNFALLDDWEERYRYLIDLGNALPPMPEALKTTHTKVQGCMSQVWMVLSWDAQGRLCMQADSDAQIVRGLIAVLRVIYDGQDRAAAQSMAAADIFASMGMDQHLSPNRRNGFFSMLEKIRAFVARG